MTKNKFVIKNATEQTNKKGETFKVFKYNKNKKGVSKKNMMKYLAKTIKSIPDNYEYAITSLTDVGWRGSGKGWRQTSNDLEIYDPEVLYGVELDKKLKYYSAAILVRERINKATGGYIQDTKNDCLYYCLTKALGDTLKSVWSYPSSLKKFLKIERNDMVSLDSINKIENKLKTKIIISGDCCYNSGSLYNRIVEIELKDNHYELKKKSKDSITKKLIHSVNKNKTEAILLVYTQYGDDKTITYNGIKFKKIDNDKFNERRYKSYDSKYFYINTQCLLNDNIEIIEKKLKDKHEQNTKEINEIKELKNKYPNDKNYDINPLMFRDLNCFVLYYAYYWGLKNFEVEDLDQLESKFIDNALTGGLIYADKGKYSNVECYDINSMYPNFFSQSGLLVPIKKGKFSNETELKDILSYGIYRCIISGDIDPKLFRINKSNYYTHFDIYSARQLGYNIELIQDGQVNSLIYGGNYRVQAKTMFKKYIDHFYGIKKLLKGNRMAKSFLNLLWGILCQKQLKYSNLIYSDNADLLKDFKMSGDNVIITTYNDETLFKHPMARLGPFLTANARKYMSNIMQPYKDDILRVHTDGFIIKGNHNIPTSLLMGKLKLEYKADKINIIHVNKIIIN